MKLTLNDAIAAGKAASEAIRGNVAEPEEILRRAKICLACPEKTRVRGILPRISHYLGELSRKHAVPEEIAGNMCGVCKCGFSLLVPATIENAHVDSPKQLASRPDNCWLKQINENKLK